MKNNERTKNIIFTILALLAVVIIIFPTSISGYFTIYNADDFSVANFMSNYSGSLWITVIGAFRYMCTFYKTLQGTYVSEFIQALLVPLNGFGWKQLHIIMFFNVVLLAASIAYIVYSFCMYFKIRFIHALAVIIIVIVGIFGFYSWNEVITWYSGAVVYSFSVIFGLFAVGLMIKDRKHLSTIFVASFLGILTSGGNLEVAGTVCYLMLICAVIKKLQKKYDKCDLVIFVSTVIGALINVAAPGNYLRHEAIDDSGMHLFEAIGNTVIVVFEWIKNMLVDCPFVVLLFIAMWIGFNKGKQLKRNNKIAYLFMILILLLPFVTAFPVCLGYSSTDLPNRCQFVLAISIVFALVAIAISIGYLIGNRKEKFSVGKVIIGIILFYIVISGFNSNWRVNETVLFKMYGQVIKGEFKKYYTKCREIYGLIESDTNSDVFIFEFPEEINNYYCLGISEDVTWWYNNATAHYYGKNTVQLVEAPIYYNGSISKVFRIWPEMFECDLDYVTIYKVNGNTGEVEYIQELEPLDRNMIIEADAADDATVMIEVYGDDQGDEKIDELELLW
jgi:hypothetical protein